jgi:hypothetical protein
MERGECLSTTPEQPEPKQAFGEQAERHEKVR